MKSHEEQEVRDQAERARGTLRDLAANLRVVDDEAESLAQQRKHHELLAQACGSLEELFEAGASSLFWGESASPVRVAEQLREVRSRVDAFEALLGELDERREAIRAEIGREEKNLEVLDADLDEILEQEERRKLEWIVEREISPLPPRVQLMAWARGGEDDRRFRKTLAASMLVSLLLGALLPMIDLPLPKRFVPDEMPKRLAQLVRAAKEKPIPPPPVVAPPEEKEPDKPEPVEQPTEQPDQPVPEVPAVAEAEPTEQPGPGPAETAAEPKRAVAKAGILAFKDKFASLAKDDVAPRLGAAARYSQAEEASQESRSMLTTNEPGSSGGINIASLSRSVGSGNGDGPGGGGGIHGVQVGRATSSIASIGGGERPLARGGPGPGRTDEEIQIVFDRYKASFYRLYNRELRKDPTLRGQMVLRLTIEPDGSVSMCKLESTDMDAPDLATQVVDRVRSINFGAKEGVEALTIVYPIDFLPAS